ncbi:MAG: CopG family ribbon-helix-helix protein [Chloroflexia bacterium]
MATRVAISGRVPEELSRQVDRLAEATRRNRSWVVEEAVRQYVEEQAWQIHAIQEAMNDYRNGTAKLVPHDEVMAELEALEAEISATLPS